MGEEKKLLPDSVFEKLFMHTNSNQKKKHISFLTSHSPRNWVIAWGVIPGGTKYAKEPWKGSELPQPVKWATLFRANPVIIILQVSSLTTFIIFCLIGKGAFFFRKWDSFFKYPNLPKKIIPKNYPELEIWNSRPY